MTTDDKGRGGIQEPRSDDTLNRIAELLGCSPEALIGEAGTPADVRQMRELIDLWGLMDTDDKRERALDFMRNLANA